MEFSWQYVDSEPQLLRRFIRRLGISRSYLKWIKFDGGQILVNGRAVTVRHYIEAGDWLTIVPPIEHDDRIVADFTPLELVYEDRDLLIINKPAGRLSIPTKQEAAHSVVNQVKAYYQQQNYPNQVVHIVTRLDRQTSGLMLIAKHRLAKSYLSQQLTNGQLIRQYLALSHRLDWPKEGTIDAPIARHVDSIITRRVDANGQPARTDYWLEEQLATSTLLRLQLQTGRTHQIRVHLADQKGVIVGDDLYGAPANELLQRQALHCAHLSLVQPLTNERLTFDQPLPLDMQRWVNNDQPKND